MKRKEKKIKKTLIQTQQPKDDNVNANNNNLTLLVEPNFSGKTYLMWKFFSRILDKDFYIINKSPPEQYSKTKIKIKEKSFEFKPLNEYENDMVVFDNNLGSSSSKFLNQFCIRGRNKNLDIYYQSQSFFDLSKRRIGKNSNKIILFNQTK